MEKEQWLVSPIVCLECGYRWVGIYQGSPETFECDDCGEMAGVRDDEDIVCFDNEDA
jgi:hypothetical protein